MTSEVKEVVIVCALLTAGVALHAFGATAESAMAVGAACALCVPRAGTVARIGVALGAGALLSLGASGCGTVGKPEVREAVRLGCQVADWALSGEDCAEGEGE